MASEMSQRHVLTQEWSKLDHLALIYAIKHFWVKMAENSLWRGPHRVPLEFGEL